MRLITAVLLAAGLAAAPALRADTPDERARQAVAVLDAMMAVPEQAVPRKLFEEAHAIAVIPDLVKAGFVVGGRHGKGLVSVRGPDGIWSAPAFIRLTGGSVGFQAGIQASDLILVFRSRRGVDSIVHGKFTLGADAAVAAGPVGRTAQASTDAQLKAEIYAYARSRGLFAGIAVDGAVLSIDHEANAEAYGGDTTPRMVFEGRIDAEPEGTVDFRDRLEEYTAGE